MTAVKSNASAFQYASKYLRENREIVMATVRLNGKTLEFVPRQFQIDREVVMAAVTSTGWALKFASKDSYYIKMSIILLGSLNIGHYRPKKVIVVYYYSLRFSIERARQ